MTFWIFLIVFIILISAAYGAISAAPWVPTRQRDVVRMVGLAQIKPGEVVYDLGCGDGRLVFAAARAGAKATGIEIFVLPYLWAKVKSFFVPGASVRFGDFFRHNLSDADVVFVFLMSESYPRLERKLAAELKPGVRVITSCWPLQRWNPLAATRPNGTVPIYIQKVS